MKYLPITFLFIFINYGNAQASFVDQTDSFLAVPCINEIAVGIADMNNDGLDDIVQISNGTELIILYQNIEKDIFSSKSVAMVSDDIILSICIADTDNDGVNEILVGGHYESFELMKSEFEDLESPIKMLLPEGESIYVQGTNFVDIDNDGMIDIFACNDDGGNYIWSNEDGEAYKINNDWIDFSVDGSIQEKASGNYGSIWSDIDNDGDQDLYIAKCRAQVSDQTDPRRINVLHVNDGDGTFSESASAWGIDIGWQSWTADFQDLNNDGFMDLFVTNHDHASQVFLNDGIGGFLEIENSGINVFGNAIQGIMRDFDNDGWVDILVAGSKPQVFFNNRDSTFTELDVGFGANTMYSFALGDLNNDGFIDIYGVESFPSGFDKVWLNSGESENNYFSVRLQGTVSNRNAIGARVEIYGEWGKQIREVRSGESYGIMNSLTQYFGIGQSNEIDSMIVRWPSGTVQLFDDLEVNSKVLVVEGVGQLPTVELKVSNAVEVFPNPTSGIVNLELEAQIELPANLSIFDDSGRLMSSIKMEINRINYDMSSLENGIYSFIITTQKYVLNKKVMVLK